MFAPTMATRTCDTLHVYVTSGVTLLMADMTSWSPAGEVLDLVWE